MQGLPVEVNEFFAQNLSINDILSLASTNQQIRKLFERRDVNDRLADHFGFPYGLTYIELKEYEKRSLSGRMIEAAKLGDERIFKRLAELGGNHDDLVSLHAIENDDEKLLDMLIELRAINLSKALNYIVYKGKIKLFEKLIKLLDDSLTNEDLNDLLCTAAEYHRLDLVVRLVELGADDFDRRFRWH